MTAQVNISSRLPCRRRGPCPRAAASSIIQLAQAFGFLQWGGFQKAVASSSVVAAHVRAAQAIPCTIPALVIPPRDPQTAATRRNFVKILLILGGGIESATPATGWKSPCPHRAPRACESQSTGSPNHPPIKAQSTRATRRERDSPNPQYASGRGLPGRSSNHPGSTPARQPPRSTYSRSAADHRHQLMHRQIALPTREHRYAHGRRVRYRGQVITPE